MTSHEVSLAYGDMRRVSELEAQLASAQAALLLAQADAETLRMALDYYGTHEEDCVVWRDPGDPDVCSCGFYSAARAEHPGQALHDEVAAARAANAIMYKALGQIDKHRVGAYMTEEGAGANVEPCEECGEMRDIAEQALALVWRYLREEGLVKVKTVSSVPRFNT